MISNINPLPLILVLKEEFIQYRAKLRKCTEKQNNNILETYLTVI